MLNGWTCPEIDKNIDIIKNEIKDFLKDMIDEFSPMISQDEQFEYRDYYSNQLYDKISCYIEEIRLTNSNLRDSAEKEISKLTDEIYDLEKEIEDKKEIIDKLDDDLAELRNQYE